MRVMINLALPQHGQAETMKDSITPVAGSDFATGRPATGRNRGLSVRISEEAYNLVKREKNKSEYIDRLIINDNKKRGRQD
mgnify:CR=1 FL=1